MTAVVYYLIFASGWWLTSARVPYLVLAIITNLITAIVTYPMYRIVVFRVSGPWTIGFLRFYVTSIWALTYALVGLPLLVELVHLPVLVAVAIVIITGPLVNYQIHRLWAFRERGPH